LQILHIDVPADVQGRNLLEAMEGKPGADSRTVYAETFLPRLHFNWSELRSVETDKYHFIEAPKPELYDLRADPGELHNLVAEKQAVADELRARLKSLIVQNSAGQELAEKTGLDPTLMERLKSLGYAGFSSGASQEGDYQKLPDPKDRVAVYELFSEAMAESQHGQYDQSAEKLTAILKTEPDSVPAHYILGLNYYRMHQFALAIEHLRRVMQLSPEYALASYQLGLAYARSGEMDNAEQTFKQTLELDPTNFDAAYNLGAVYLQLKMVPQAVAALHQSATINPDYEPAHKALGDVLLYQGHTDEALVELRRAAELRPEDPEIHASLAKAFAAKGMDQEAQEEMRRAQQVQPQP
jgi:Flp pilus assembly protein TadD